MAQPRRFPPPWSVEDIDAAYVVKDSGGRRLAYVYYEEEWTAFVGEDRPYLVLGIILYAEASFADSG
jgi:hypothetical protein